MTVSRVLHCRRFGTLVTPPSLLALPLYRRPIFPGIVAPIVVPNERFGSTLQVLRDGLPMNVGLFLSKEAASDGAFNKIEHIHQIGLLAQVLRVFPHKQGQSQAVVIGLNRIHATHATAADPFQVAVEAVEDQVYSEDVTALTNEIILACQEILKLRPVYKEQFATIVEQVDVSNPGDLADCVAGLITNVDKSAAQAVLECTSIPERMKLALQLLKKEIAYGEVQSQLHKQTDPGAGGNKTHRRFVLMEQLKSIKKELGMDADEKDVLLTKFQSRCATRQIPESVLNTINEECSKLGGLEPSSSEFAVTRNYLDWLTILPWGVTTPENFNLDKARQVLNDDHFGLDDVKERIMELIAVGSFKGTVNGKILCLVGPPGTGKTSIGKSIARALERKFFRFSVGGMTDVAEIKGHRRTYVGAMPGKLIQALKVTQTSNPVLLIDEIDKVGRGVNGDPASALLEVLDPEQNSSFLDHYLDVPFDVSKVLFLVTANSLETIPRPLLDRMEVISLAGYVTEEKISIAQRYLVPRAISDCGLTSDKAEITEEALGVLIRGYCREAGVRNLRQQLDKIFRKVTLHVAAEQSDKIVITPENLADYVGLPVYVSDRYHERTPPGVVMGLAYTSHGGQTLYIESISSKGSPSLQTTGHLGEVMTESSNIALSYAKAFLSKVDSDNNMLDTCAIHMHVPCGGTPKDGPSAGCAMVTSLLSLALNRPVTNNLAMTGEVTLTGKVLRIGGVREKVMAARRSGCTDIILPEENKAEFEELPDYVKLGVNVHYASDYSDIYALAFENADQGAKLVEERTAV